MMQLFTFPYAGGSFYAFRELEAQLPSTIKCNHLELPGRGKKIVEELLHSAEDVVEHYFQEITKIGLAGGNYAFYGHSMGGLMQFLLVHKLKEKGLPLPKHIFVSGRYGPQHDDKEPNRYNLPPEAFKAKVFELGGMPQAILENEELLEFFLPILRADFQAIETWSCTEHAQLDIPITVFHGNEERFSVEASKEWQAETTLPINVHTFPGDHFFILQHWSAIAQTIEQDLTKHQ